MCIITDAPLRHLRIYHNWKNPDIQRNMVLFFYFCRLKRSLSGQTCIIYCVMKVLGLETNGPSVTEAVEFFCWFKNALHKHL